MTKCQDRNSFQVKEKDKLVARELSETDKSNIFDGELKATIIRTLAGLEKRIGEISETLTTEIKER